MSQVEKRFIHSHFESMQSMQNQHVLLKACEHVTPLLSFGKAFIKPL